VDNIQRAVWKLIPTRRRGQVASFNLFFEGEANKRERDALKGKNALTIDDTMENLTLSELPEGGDWHSEWLVHANKGHNVIHLESDPRIVLSGNPTDTPVTPARVGDIENQVNDVFTKSREDAVPDDARWATHDIDPRWEKGLDLPVLATIDSFSVSIRAPDGSDPHTFTKPSELQNFLQSEQDFWSKECGAGLPSSEVLKDFSHGLELLTKLCDHCQMYSPNIRDILQQLKDAVRILITSQSSHGKTYMGLKEKGTNERAKGFLVGLFLKETPLQKQQPTPELLFGMISARQMIQGDSLAIQSTAPSQQNTEALLEKVKDAIAESMAAASEDRKQADANRTRLRELVEDHKVVFQEARTAWDDLIQVFEENLRVKAAVTYWDSFAKAKLWPAWIFLVAFLLTMGLAGYVLHDLLMKPPESLTEATSFAEITPSFVRLSMLILAGFGLAVYLMRILLKLSMSAFHARADAKERARLTEAYLALIKDDPDSVPPEQREIILTSLFSRSDTGLLKDDGHPVFPAINTFFQRQ